LIGPNIPLLRRAVEEFAVRKLRIGGYPVLEISHGYVHIHFDGWQGTTRELERVVLRETPSLTDIVNRALDGTDFEVDLSRDLEFFAPDRVMVPIRK